MKWGTSAVFLVAALSGCATSPGDELFSRRQYASAADAYEAELKDHPNDQGLLRKQAKASELGLKELAERLGEARRSGDAAQVREYSAHFVSRYRAWGQPAAFAAMAKEEAEFVRGALEREVRADLRDGAPLRAWAVLRDPNRVEELSWSPTAELQRQVLAAAHARCDRAYSKGRPGPHAQLVRYRYCAAFGFDLPPPPPAPTTFGHLHIEVGIAGISSLAQPVIHKLEYAFKRSPWFDRRSVATLEVALRGYVEDLRAHGGGPGETSYTWHLWPAEKDKVNGMHVGYWATLDVLIEEPFHMRVRNAVPRTAFGIDPAQLGTRKTITGAMALDAELLESDVKRGLEHAWREAFCRSDEEDPEMVARCVYGYPWADDQPGIAAVFGEPPGAFTDTLFVESTD